MPHETLPADIAAAIGNLTSLCTVVGQFTAFGEPADDAKAQREAARATLEATILRHLADPRLHREQVNLDAERIQIQTEALSAIAAGAV